MGFIVNNKVKYVIYVVIFILVLVGINVGYDFLNDKIQKEKEQSQVTSQNKTTKWQQAKDFSVYNDKDEEVKLSSFNGKPIVMNFWTTWCGYCKVEMPYFEELYKQHNNDVTFLMINSTTEDNKQDIEKYIQTEGFTFPVYYDQNASEIRTYKITGYPVTVFINRDFEIVKIHQGMITKDTLEKYINSIK